MNELMLDLPSRSPDGLAALDIFYEDFNDVNFYVEDEEQENLYWEILRKLFSDIRISRIFPLGGKPAVIQHVMSGSSQEIKCFRAYILDRDFDHLLGIQVEHPNVFYLDSYCIENHLLESAAMVELVIENHPKRRRSDVEANLSLEARIPSFYSSLRPLFTLFFCTQQLNLGVKNCSAKPEAFCEQKQLWELKSASVASYRGELLAAASAKGMSSDLFHSQFELASSHVSTASDHELVSGKFIAAMLFHYLQKKARLGSITFESFVYRLAKNCKLGSMRAFAKRVRAGKRTYNSGRSNAKTKRTSHNR